MNIKEHEWFDMTITLKNVNQTAVCLDTENIPWIGISKDDVIALAKHFKLNPHDIQCNEHIELQNDLNSVDEMHYEEMIVLRAQVADLNRKLRMKEVN